MRQWTVAKNEHPDTLLFFRMGDFYELFYDDAIVAARELQITLTARDRERAIPMCGVPYHSAEGYLQRLLRKGFRIAICEQMEDPKLTKKIVRREVTRVLTPGTAFDTSLGQEQNNFLAALHEDGATSALALLDLSTGEFRTAEFTGPTAHSQAIDELLKAQPSEVLLPVSVPDGFATEMDRSGERVAARTRVDDWVWTRDYAVPLVERKLGVRSLEGFGLSGHPTAAIAAGVVLHYVQSTQKLDALHLDSLRFVERSNELQLDPVTVRNLELVEPLVSGTDTRSTLFHTLDASQTPMGKRLLRATILRPLYDADAINKRYEAVAEAHSDLVRREEIRKAFTGILDLERLLARLSLDSAGPRDVAALAASLARLPALHNSMKAMTAPLWRDLTTRLDTLIDIATLVEKTLAVEPPVTLVDGGVIAPGVSAELDELRSISSSGRQSIAAIEERERARTGIASLKVRYNSVFGYYIEISKSNLANAPADYERKQTLVNAERFTTPELKDYETRVLTAHDRAIEIEKLLFAQLRRSVLEAASRIRRASAVVAEADLLAGFAHLASVRGYTRPELVDEPVLEAVAARHPVIENWMSESGTTRFIPNSLYLHGHNPEDAEPGNTDPSLLLITGPNMGGKSTYLRQAAMLILMAQMGCYVPAAKMRYGLVDRIYTRIGASDNVARGRSTFMVEMTETATILNTATSKSLVLLDEMGRGTATFDGLSLAWATVEFLHAEIGARTLFATHYHELTMLAEKLPRVLNLRVAVKESSSGIVFLHSIEPGAASKSYGIEVARLAGLPKAVLERARHVLRQHEKQERRSVQVETAEPVQMTIFTPLSQRIVDRIAETDINSLTPLQALNLLEELKQELGETAAPAGGNHPRSAR
ncbi:DNA mismatch repair protein MutS [Acidicapsa acidisoli]|uniref:DNA mismatch repair protein MutS n=1 Tax=Acidicapsa acidisoli TaxID=1615681 RepID=UPI0021DF9D29|nr:DNA mismatch repair protein MutS [Acidicapsa acidisoli]